MKILSGLLWQTAVPDADNMHSLFIKQFDSRKGPLFMALICAATVEDKRPGAACSDQAAYATFIGGYFCEEMQAWFEESYLGIILGKKPFARIKRELLKTQRRICEELELKAAKDQQKIRLSFALLISFRRDFIIMQQGAVKLYMLKRRMKDMGVDGQLKSGKGRLRPGLGILLGSESFTSGISEQQLMGALRAKDLRDEQLINKRLSHIAEYAATATKRQAAKQGSAQTDRAAIYISTLWGSSPQS